MAIVCVDLESTLPSWYTAAVYSAGTTYAQDDYVIPAAASGLYSGTTAVLWKSLQNGNTGNALTEGAWWTVVADGSAAKPYKSIDDATRFAAAGANDIRIKAGLDHTVLSDSYTFYCIGTNAGKCVKTGSADTINVGDFIGDDTMGFFRVRGITGTGPYTLDIGTTTTGSMFWHITEADVTPSVCYKANPIQLQSTQTAQKPGADVNNRMVISCGWNAAFTSQNTLKRTYMTGSAYQINSPTYNPGYIVWDGLCCLGVGRFFLTNANPVVNNCMVSFPGNSTHVAFNCGGSTVTNSTFIGANGVDLGSVGGNVCSDCIVIFGQISNHSSIVKNTFIAKGANNLCTATYGAIYRFNNTKLGKVNSTNVGVFYNNTSLEISAPRIFCVNCTFTETLLKSYRINLVSMNHNGVIDDHRFDLLQGKILSDSTTRHTASGIAWRFEPGSIVSEVYPLEFITQTLQDPFEVAVSANKRVTATIWCKKSTTDAAFEARFICRGGQLAGIVNDVTAVATDSTDWQQLTIQVTPTETGVLRFGFQVWGSTTATCHIDDFGVSQ